MAGIIERRKTGPKGFVPDAVITGGQLVEAKTGGRIIPATAGSTKVLGVALTDAIRPEDVTTAATVGPDGRLVTTMVALPTNVAVAYAPAEVPVTASAAVAFGDAVVATASGKVGPAGATPDARTLVGVCTAHDGIAANAVGYIRLTR